jgi:hypothetical protein
MRTERERGSPAPSGAGNAGASAGVLRAVLAAEGGLLAAALGPEAPADTEPLHLAAAREGQRLHAGSPQVVTGADPDLALLAGDRLYALGVEDLAARGDLAGVAALADVISECAQAQADGDAARAELAWKRLVRRQDGAVAGRNQPQG